MARIKRTSYKDSHFYIWKQRIDNHVFKHIHIHLDDLPDEQYRSYFESSSLTPKQISSKIIESFYFDTYFYV